MTITTNFNPGEKVFVLMDDRIREMWVEEIFIAAKENEGFSTIYKLRYPIDAKDKNQYMSRQVKEDKMFETKEELIKNL